MESGTLEVQIGLAIVDDHAGEVPRLTPDAFWDEKSPEIPYTKATRDRCLSAMVGSCVNLKLMGFLFCLPSATSFR